MTAEGTDFTIYREAMIVLATAAVLVPLGQRFRLSPILGFLIAGAVLGPHGLGALQGVLPPLQWITVSEERGLGAMAELGVVFLLFIIGLELSLTRLITMRRLVFGLGTLQVSISAVIIGSIAALYGAGAGAATLIGFSLALSSTAVVIEVLSRGGRLSSSTGRTSFAILLLQDLAVVPLLFLVNILGPESEGNLLAGLAQAFGQAVLVIGLIALVGKALLRPLFRSVAAAGSTELFVAAALFVAVGSGLVTAAAGLSMALGAFVAGLLLAETEYHRAIEATIDPFKGLLLGVFFFSVGMSLDIAYLWNNPLPIMLGLLCLIAIKSGVLVVLLRWFRVSWPATIETSALLGPGGEFAFIVIGLAMAKKIVEPGMGELVLALTSFSMALVPALDYVARRWSRSLTTKREAADPALSVPPPKEHFDAIVIGCGRVGALVSEMLKRHGVKHIIVERDPAVVSRCREEGYPVYFGDAKNPQFLKRCGLDEARGVVITINKPSAVSEIVTALRELRDDIIIVARARDAEHARQLYKQKVSDAVPETIEASLQLSEATLVGLGVPTGPVIASIHEKRDEFREQLQGAAGRPTRGLRASQKKRSP
ncbi:potassium transporter TrkA [Hyphomicrobium sp. xq]|uniref:Potassium transporter TrkA n=1 Tax=Hyphomicrobium album TaxID=2665159 RepID=A0A6I3KH41_9HYPH|nr:cation:proton antiporter [Hyphomicrobium album]MTD93320.1 potassium transporter TrkA [Hyphomicrobium album]